MGVSWVVVAHILVVAPPVEAPVVPGATALLQQGRYQSPRSYEKTLDYYKRLFRSTGGVQWRHVVNLPGIKAKHVKSLFKRTNWEGINIYEHSGDVRIFVISRDLPKVGSMGAKRRKRHRN